MARGDNPDFRQAAFNAGEWAPEMYGRSDHKKYKYALKRCRNSIALAQGPLIKRPGTLMCGTVPSAPLHMKEFIFSDSQALVLVFTDSLLSFFQNGQKIPATLATPYLAADLGNLKFAQSGDVVTITCRGYKPRDLKRLSQSNLSWSISDCVYRAPENLAFPAWSYGTTPPQLHPLARSMPTFVGFLTSGASAYNLTWGTEALAKAWSWAVTAVYADGTESLPAFTPEVLVDRLAHTLWIQIYIDQNCGLRPSYFNVYLGRQGTYGLLDSVDASSNAYSWGYRDTGAAPDFQVEPPSWPLPFSPDFGGYAVGKFYGKGDRFSSGGKFYEAASAGVAGGVSVPTTAAGTTLDGRPAGYPAGSTVTAGQYYCFGGAVWVVQTGGACAALSTATYGQGGTQFNSTITDGSVVFKYVSPGGFVTWKVVDGTFIDVPALAFYNGQRKMFADFYGRPTRIVGSRVGAYSDFNVQATPLDDDAIDFDLASNRYEEIRSFLELKQLMALTSERSWMVSGANGGKPTPSSIMAQPNLVRGASWLDPLVIGVSGLYVQALGTQIWELVFDFYTQSYLGSDVTLQAQHLFKGHQIVRWAFAPVPMNLIWAVQDTGKLLGLTYHREEEVKAWHWHDTQGMFLDVCCIPETINGVAETSVYLAAQRQTPTGTAFCIERMASTVLPVAGYDANGGAIVDTRRGVFLDSAVQGTGHVISGLGHLEGLPVTVLADGEVAGPYTVSGGQIDITADFPDGPPSIVIAGLDYVSEGEQLDLTTESAEIRSNVKNVYRVSFEVANTRGMKIGADFGNLVEWQQRQVSDGFNPEAPFTGLDHIRIPSRYEHGGRICFRHDYPLPFTLLALGRETSLGGD